MGHRWHLTPHGHWKARPSPTQAAESSCAVVVLGRMRKLRQSILHRLRSAARWRQDSAYLRRVGEPLPTILMGNAALRAKLGLTTVHEQGGQNLMLLASYTCNWQVSNR